MGWPAGSDSRLPLVAFNNFFLSGSYRKHGKRVHGYQPKFELVANHPVHVLALTLSHKRQEKNLIFSKSRNENLDFKTLVGTVTYGSSSIIVWKVYNCV